MARRCAPIYRVRTEAMADPLDTPLCALLGIRLPIVLAPMAGGPTGPELVAAVERAGGLGVFGVMGMTCDEVRRDVERAFALGATRIGINVQLARASPGRGRPEDVAEALSPLSAELDVAPEADPPRGDPPIELVRAGLEAGAGVVSAALGDPAPLAPLAREAGAPLIAMVSTVEEAVGSVAAGADVVIAQGAEAGGHRTTFEIDDDLPLVGTLALVPRVVDAVDVPVVAAGGIMDGRGIAAALALGAQGVSLGTRFLSAREARTPAAYRATLAGAGEADTVITDAVTGRPARLIRNRVVDTLASGPPHLGWGAQRGAVEPLRRAAAEAGRADLLPMLAGQGAGMAPDGEPAEAIVAALADHARAVIAGLAAG
jgi:nitronate monooxygenase